MAPFPVQLVRLGSIFWLALQSGDPPNSAEAIDPEGADRYRQIFQGLMQRGIALAPSAYEVGFLSLAHTGQHLERLASALADTFKEMSV